MIGDYFLARIEYDIYEQAFSISLKTGEHVQCSRKEVSQVFEGVIYF